MGLMKIKKGQQLELEITDIAFGGKGLAKVDGLTVFVDKGIPGDRVVVRIRKKKKSFAEAYVTEILESSPDRIIAPCPYSGTCGRCKWQFLEYERQLQFKQQYVAESIEHIGLIGGENEVTHRVYGAYQ